MLEILPFCTCVKKSQSYDVWFLRYGVRLTEFCVILGHFLPFYHPLAPSHTPTPNDPQNQNFEKKNEKNTWRYYYYYYTNMCTINEDHMIYSSRNIRCDIHNFLSFWAIFYPFSPLKTWKIKILKLNKTPGDIILLHIHTTNENTMMYGS